MVFCVDGTLAHYWQIETPDGPKSPGVCSKCKAQSTFENSIETHQITLERSQDQEEITLSVTPWRDVRATWRMPVNKVVTK